MPWHDPPKEGDVIAADRRGDKRYDLHLELHWKLIRRHRVLETGSGYTVNLSRTGILFDAGKPLPSGLNVEISVAWPVMPLQLVVYGKIVRTFGNRVAIRTVQQAFRTLGVAREKGAGTG